MGKSLCAIQRVGVIRPEPFPGRWDQRFEQSDPLVRAVGGEVSRSEVVAADQRIGVVEAEFRLGELERRLEQRDRLPARPAAR